MADYKKELSSNGYCILKSTVLEDDLLNFRNTSSDLLELIGVHKHKGIRLPFAFKYAPQSIDVFKIFQNLKSEIDEALDCDDWLLTGHCDLHKNALSGWHRDDGTSYGDGGYFGRIPPDYQTTDLGVFKVAVYLQPHNIFEDGLTVEPGSHLREQRNNERSQYLKTRLGEIVIFDQRLWHTGQLETSPKLIFEEKTSGKRSDDTKILVEKKDRMSVFFTVRRNVPTDHPAIEFEKNNMRRQVYEIATSANATFSATSMITPAMRQRAAQYNVYYSNYCEDV